MLFACEEPAGFCWWPKEEQISEGKITSQGKDRLHRMNDVAGETILGRQKYRLPRGTEG